MKVNLPLSDLMKTRTIHLVSRTSQGTKKGFNCMNFRISYSLYIYLISEYFKRCMAYENLSDLHEIPLNHGFYSHEKV